MQLQPHSGARGTHKLSSVTTTAAVLGEALCSHVDLQAVGIACIPCPLLYNCNKSIFINEPSLPDESFNCMISCLSPGRSREANCSAQPLAFTSVFWIPFPVGLSYICVPQCQSPGLVKMS